MFKIDKDVFTLFYEKPSFVQHKSKLLVGSYKISSNVLVNFSNKKFKIKKNDDKKLSMFDNNYNIKQNNNIANEFINRNRRKRNVVFDEENYEKKKTIINENGVEIYKTSKRINNLSLTRQFDK